MAAIVVTAAVQGRGAQVSVIESALDGRYRVLAPIASGGMGDVYRARDEVLQRDVAIKVLHPHLADDRGFIDRFRREARASAVLNHPNIVGVFDWGSADGTYFMVMEYVRGHNLRALLEAYRRLAPSQVIEVAVQVLSALDHAHGHGIVHRDVKPENILIDQTGTVKVADFGLARAFAESSLSQAEGTVTGTVQYLSPEQIEGEPADPRTDLYSLGVVMFEMLTGEAPFRGETSFAVAYQHLSSRVPAPSTRVAPMPAELDQVVVRATQRDRDQRPSSAAEMRRELVQANRTLTPSPSIADLAERLPPSVAGPRERASTVTIDQAESPERRRARLLGSVMALVVLVAVVVSGAWATWAYVVPHYATLPDLSGVSVSAATRRLDALGLSTRLGDQVFSASVGQGLVVSTSPAVGTRVRTGTTVTLVTSAGPDLVPVPIVVGQSEEAATTLLTRSGFVPRVDRQYSDSVPGGTVMSSSPVAGQAIHQGSFVDLVVSLGPKPVTVPPLAGETEAGARAALDSSGLVSATAHEYSDTVPEGQVIRTSPQAGAEVSEGSTVILVLSNGPQIFAMPNVVGMEVAEARATLDDLGLVVQEVAIPGVFGTTVSQQDPAFGSQVHRGQTVTIYVPSGA